MQIDRTLYRALYDDALGLVRAMVPQLAEKALATKKNPAQAIGDAIDEVFLRVLEGFEQHTEFLEPPEQRKGVATKRKSTRKKKQQWDPFG